MRAIAGAQAEVAGARAPVCPSLATPLDGGSEFMATITLTDARRHNFKLSCFPVYKQS